MLDATIQRRISILVYDDIEAAHDYLVAVFGLGAGGLTRDADGRATHGEVFADIRPASTMVEVRRLIDPALLVEVEADAVVP